MYDKYNSYTAAFLIAGLPPMFFGILLTSTRCINKKSVESEGNNLHESKPLNPIPNLIKKEGKHSTIIPTDQHPLLLSKNINPNYTR